MRDQLEGSSLVSSMLPDFTIGCKRVLLSDDFLPCFRDNDHVQLVTETIEEITE